VYACFSSCRLLAGLTDSSLPQTKASTCLVWNRRIAQYYSQCGKIIQLQYHSHWPVLNIVNVSTLWKLITVTHNVSHIDAVAPRQQRSHISTITLTLIAIMTIDRPRRQCSRSSIRQSVSTTFSVARRSTWTTPIDAYNDYRSALQAVFSVIYMSVIATNQYGSSE